MSADESPRLYLIAPPVFDYELPDRLAKYNQLIRLEEDLGNDAVFAGRAILRAYSRNG